MALKIVSEIWKYSVIDGNDTECQKNVLKISWALKFLCKNPLNFTWPNGIWCKFHHTYQHLHAKHLFIGILYDYIAYNTTKNHLLLLLLNHLPPLLILPAKNIYELPKYMYTYLPCNFMKYVYHCIVLIIVHTYGKWINHFIY